jgi:flagellar FliL protein
MVMADQNPGAEVKPKSNKMMIVIVAINLLAAAGVGGFMFLGGRDSEAAAQEPALALSEPVVTVALAPFVVNLYEPGGTRYLKLVIEAEVPGETGSQIVTANSASIRNRVIAYLSGLSFADTQGPEQKDVIQKELVKQINEVLRRDVVRNVYFTEFIIQ